VKRKFACGSGKQVRAQGGLGGGAAVLIALYILKKKKKGAKEAVKIDYLGPGQARGKRDTNSVL